MLYNDSIRLHQSYPALVLELDQRQIALEKSIGAEINVWKPGEAANDDGEKNKRDRG